MNTITRQHRSPYAHRSCIASTCETCGGSGRTVRTVSRCRSIDCGTVDIEVRCETCEGYGETYRSELSEPDPEPEPTPPAAALTVTVTDSFQLAGATVTAPGFTPESFDRAIGRAFAAGLTITATDSGDTVTVTNPSNGHQHTTTRRSCTCAAGRHQRPCMHRAYACMVNDVWHALPQRQPVAA